MINFCLDSQELAQSCAWAKYDFDAIQHKVSISSQDDELIYFLNFSPYAYPEQWNIIELGAWLLAFCTVLGGNGRRVQYLCKQK